MRFIYYPYFSCLPYSNWWLGFLRQVNDNKCNNIKSYGRSSDATYRHDLPWASVMVRLLVVMLFFGLYQYGHLARARMPGTSMLPPFAKGVAVQVPSGSPPRFTCLSQPGAVASYRLRVPYRPGVSCMPVRDKLPFPVLPVAVPYTQPRDHRQQPDHRHRWFMKIKKTLKRKTHCWLKLPRHRPASPCYHRSHR